MFSSPVAVAILSALVTGAITAIGNWLVTERNRSKAQGMMEQAVTGLTERMRDVEEKQDVHATKIATIEGKLETFQPAYKAHR